jgi:hypothetical protein
MHVFIQKVELVGVNPSIEIPEKIMQLLFKQSGREKGPLPVVGLIEGKPFTHNVVRFQGKWRMYLNTAIRKITYSKVGDTITVAIEYDPKE